jgi:hypothetical protein
MIKDIKHQSNIELLFDVELVSDFGGLQFTGNGIVDISTFG